MIKTSAANRILNQAKKYMTICQIKILWNHCAHSQGRVLEGGYWEHRPRKTYESNFIHNYFVRFEKQLLRFKAILPFMVLSR